MVKEIASIAKRIFLENKYAKYDFDIPVEIKSDHTIEEIENGKCDKDIRNEIYKDTGNQMKGIQCLHLLLVVVICWQRIVQMG